MHGKAGVPSSVGGLCQVSESCSRAVLSQVAQLSMSWQCPGGNTAHRKQEQSSHPHVLRDLRLPGTLPIPVLAEVAEQEPRLRACSGHRVGRGVCVSMPRASVFEARAAPVSSAVPAAPRLWVPAKALGPSAQCKWGCFASLPVMEAG